MQEIDDPHSLTIPRNNSRRLAVTTGVGLVPIPLLLLWRGGYPSGDVL